MKRTIAISGGGIAGLTCALLLERQGFDVQIFEQAPHPAKTGTGVQLSPNAYKVLDSLGLGEALNRQGHRPDLVEISSGITGRSLTKFNLGEAIIARHGAPYLVLHRVVLSDILLHACEKRNNINIHFGHRVTGYTAPNDGVIIDCETADGDKVFDAAALIGADGVWSKLRKFVPRAPHPIFTNRIAWRVLIDLDTTPEFMSRSSTGLWLGPNAHLVHYPVYSQNQQGLAMNIVAITPWTKATPPPRNWLDEDDANERLTAFDGWQPHLRALIGSSTKWGGWPLFAAPSVGKFAHGCLCLMGDSAHAMVPFAAQGGAAAIEDAAVLAETCAAKPDNLTAAFQQYESIRQPRVRKIIKLGHNNRRIYHMKPPASWARDTVMRFTPQAPMQKRMDWLYGWTVGDTEK